MKLYRLYRKQFLPISMEQSWAFFSNASNLSRITPEWLNFSILSNPPETVWPGLILHYRITVPPGIPMQWVTEITQVQEGKLFVDEQRFGPYKLWHHQHRFSEVDNGVEMEDEVHYMLPFGWIGQLAHTFHVRNQLNEIFNFRYNYLQQYFMAPHFESTRIPERASTASPATAPSSLAEPIVEKVTV